MMSCSGCDAAFNILRKEVECDECHLAFCSRCCKKRELPSKSGEIVTKVICSSCNKQLTSDVLPAKGSPPLAHKKRMQALKKQSCSMDSESHARLKSQCSKDEDKALAERLQRLKRDRIKELPSEDEIAERLAKLKGMDPAKYKAPPIQVFRPADKRTSFEQVGDLMSQVTEEVNLDNQQVKPEEEIAARLAALRDKAPKKATNPNIGAVASEEEMDVGAAYNILHSESQDQSRLAYEDVKKLNNDEEYKKLLSSMQQEKEYEVLTEEEEADRLVKKLLETNIDEDMEGLDSLNETDNDKSESVSKQTSEEFPWCVICTEDAKIRCFGCDEDLYCMGCFRECHDSLDIKDHRTCPYLAPKSPVL